MDTPTTPAVAPAVTTAQVVAALAASLLPLAGKTGIAVSTLLPALTQLYETVKSSGKIDYSLEELAVIVASGSAHFAELDAKVNALPT